MSVTRTGLALLIAVVFAAIVSVIVVWAEMVTQGIQIGFLQMPPVAVALLLVLLALNALLKRAGETLELSRAELIGTYFAMVMAAMISSRKWVEMVIPMLISPGYYAVPWEPWETIYFPYMRQGLFPFPLDGSRGAVVDGFFSGHTPVPWGLWIGPLLKWSAVGLVSFFAMLCLAALIERQWIHYERLPFPLVRVPEALVTSSTETTGLLSPIGLAGIAIPVVLLGWNGIAANVAWLPGFPLDLSFSAVLPEKFGYTPWGISFAGIGFFYFVASEVLGSLLACFWLFKSCAYVAGLFGYEPRGLVALCTPPLGYAVIGAHYVLAGYILWMAWRGARAVTAGKPILSRNLALWGLGVSFLALCGWWVYFGVATWAAAFEVGTYLFVECILMSRGVAECGFLMTEVATHPHEAIRPFIVGGVHPATAAGLVFITVLFVRDMRGLPMTGFLDGCKLSETLGFSKRTLLKYFALGILVAMVVATYLHLAIPYSRGANNLYNYPYVHPCWFLRGFRPWAEQKLDSQTWAIPFVFAGGLVTAGIIAARYVLPWLAFRPIAIALAPAWTMTVFWFSILIAWLIKRNVLRYGGNKLFKSLSPLFLGMILGECSMAVLWTLLNIFFDLKTPKFAWL